MQNGHFGILLLFMLPATTFAADELPAKVTFAEHIAPLVFNNCTSCHRDTQVAPFTLQNYAETRRHAKTMLQVMQDRFMPPWQPEPGYGSFHNERRLSDNQIALFKKWVETGMAEGDAKKTPALPKFPKDWQLGHPDLVVKMNRPYAVPAGGPDIYQNFVIPLGNTEAKWVTAVEFRASAPEVVHHVLYYSDSTGEARAKEKEFAESKKNPDGKPGFPGMGFNKGRLGGWAVGATPIKLPEGLAYPLNKGSDIVLQTHFHPSGKAESEELTVGIYFADKAPSRTLLGVALPPVFSLFSNLQIPPGQALYKEEDSFTVPVDIDLIGVGGHAHYIGKTMRATAKLPDGKELKLFSIRDWDFNWQGQYLYKEPIRLPKGTVIHGEVTWDNSAKNPRNPSNPPVLVKWGEGTKDEMGQVGFMMVAAEEKFTPILRLAVGNYVLKRGKISSDRGDEINWKEMGITPPGFWRKDPAKQPKKDRPAQSFRDLDGKDQAPLSVAGDKAHVLIFTTTDCPIANGYIPEINALAKDLADSAVKLYAIQVDPDLTIEEARKHAKEYGLKIPVLLDTKHELVKATEVTHTPEVAVIVQDGSIAYRGRIDDLYPERGKKRLEATQKDLRKALAAILKGEKVQTPRTEAVGCLIPDLTTITKP